MEFLCCNTANQIGFYQNRNENHRAEPGATANEHACHGLCSEQHTPRQARSSLSLNVRQNYTEKIAMALDNTNSEIKKQMLALQGEIVSLRKRNAELESDYQKILDAVEKKGVLTIADMTKLAIARRLHIQK
jgi:hypothetical protein